MIATLRTRLLTRYSFRRLSHLCTLRGHLFGRHIHSHSLRTLSIFSKGDGSQHQGVLASFRLRVRHRFITLWGYNHLRIIFIHGMVQGGFHLLHTMFRYLQISTRTHHFLLLFLFIGNHPGVPIHHRIECVRTDLEHFMLSRRRLLMNISRIFKQTFSRLCSLVWRSHAITMFTSNTRVITSRRSHLTFFLRFLRFSVTFYLRGCITGQGHLVSSRSFQISVSNGYGYRSSGRATKVNLCQLMRVIPSVHGVRSVLRLFVGFFFEGASRHSVRVGVFSTIMFRIGTYTRLRRNKGSTICLRDTTHLVWCTNSGLWGHQFTKTIHTGGTSDLSFVGIRASVLWYMVQHKGFLFYRSRKFSRAIPISTMRLMCFTRPIRVGYRFFLFRGRFSFA